METKIIETCKKYVVEFFDKNITKNLTYHNFDHTQNVINYSYQLGTDANLESNDLEILTLAALFHDIGYLVDKNDHEVQSSIVAKEYLEKINYPKQKSERVQSLILATKMDWLGDDYLAFLLKDADLSNLADQNYLKISDKLRHEKNNYFNYNITKEEWDEENLIFFLKHKYLSKEGKKRFNKAKKINLKNLKNKIAKNNHNIVQTINSSKSAQTQLKTSLRNHIDLSSIADNKANIMLSVNAMIITVGTPLLLSSLNEYPNLLFPIIILAIASILSMVFATLATRPISMKGITDISLVPQKKTNMFFFGNFYKM